MNLHIFSSSLKHSYFGSLFVSDVLVDGEDEHESKEEAGASQDVPDVMSDVNNKIRFPTRSRSPVVEVEHLARLVQFPRLCWRQI